MPSIRAIESAFHANLESVQRLIDFDRTVLDAAIQIIDGLRVSVDQKNPALADRVGNAVQNRSGGARSAAIAAVELRCTSSLSQVRRQNARKSSMHALLAVRRPLFP
jgi:hypothetical protein